MTALAVRVLALVPPLGTVIGTAIAAAVPNAPPDQQDVAIFEPPPTRGTLVRHGVRVLVTLGFVLTGCAHT
jgi:hypothetical protein